MRYKIFIIVALGLLTAGCNKNSNGPVEHKPIYSSQLISLVREAISGSSTANDSLNSLTDVINPSKTEYNKVFADSIVNSKGKRIYFILLEHPVPVYNRFAIYDDMLRCYLIDKSLNGYLKSSIIRSGGELFIQIDEEFISKDDLEITRRSLYLIKNDTASLAFRNFIKLKKNKNSFEQSIISINKDSISTSINANGSQQEDAFYYDSKQLKYVSKNEVFQKLVLNEISSYNKKTTKPQITDEKSALESIGMTPQQDTINSTNNYKDHEEGFSLFIPEDWKALKNFVIPGVLRKQCKGTYFMNNSRGVKFYVVKIPASDSAEAYIKQPFTNFVKGKYFVRYTEKVIVGNMLYLYFEISNGSKKFLFFFEAPKLVYDEKKDMYTSIVNSFSIE